MGGVSWTVGNGWIANSYSPTIRYHYLIDVIIAIILILVVFTAEDAIYEMRGKNRVVGSHFDEYDGWDSSASDADSDADEAAESPLDGDTDALVEDVSSTDSTPSNASVASLKADKIVAHSPGR